MKICFDSSVLIAALVVQHPQHDLALRCYLRGLGEGIEACCTTHALAECYASLTAMPLKQRIQPAEAHELIAENLIRRLTILETGQTVYSAAIRNVADLGFRSGMVYDALHLAAAEAASCERLYTFNMKHFLRLEPKGIEVLSP